MENGAFRLRASGAPRIPPAAFLVAIAVFAGLTAVLLRPAPKPPAEQIVPEQPAIAPQAPPDPDRSSDGPSPTPPCVEAETARDPPPAFPASPFAWPGPLEPLRRPEEEFPTSVGQLEGPELRAERVANFYRRSALDPFGDVFNSLFKIPELLLDDCIALVGAWSPRIETRSWNRQEEQGIASALLDIEIGPRREPIFTEFSAQWNVRERKYLAGFNESRAAAVGFDGQARGDDLREWEVDQRKVLFDALRGTYLARYKLQANERLRDDAWYFDRWRAADFVVLPPLMAAYVYYRGLDKKISLGEAGLRISIEPLSNWVGRSRRVPGAAGLEAWLRGIPVCVIVSADRDGMDFVGVGTGLGPARQALVMLYETDLR